MTLECCHLSFVPPLIFWARPTDISMCVGSRHRTCLCRHRGATQQRRGNRPRRFARVFPADLPVVGVKSSFGVPETKRLLMEEILHQLRGSLSHFLQGFIHPRWCRISSISSTHPWNTTGLISEKFCSSILSLLRPFLLNAYHRPGAQLFSIFEGQPSKTRPQFQSKQGSVGFYRDILCIRMYTYTL